jgi:hypothetical protein
MSILSTIQVINIKKAFPRSFNWWLPGLEMRFAVEEG